MSRHGRDVPTRRASIVGASDLRCWEWIVANLGRLRVLRTAIESEIAARGDHPANGSDRRTLARIDDFELAARRAAHTGNPLSVWEMVNGDLKGPAGDPATCAPIDKVRQLWIGAAWGSPRPSAPRQLAGRNETIRNLHAHVRAWIDEGWSKTRPPRPEAPYKLAAGIRGHAVALGVPAQRVDLLLSQRVAYSTDEERLRRGRFVIPRGGARRTVPVSVVAALLAGVLLPGEVGSSDVQEIVKGSP